MPKREPQDRIRLTREEKEDMIVSLRDYFLKERDEEMGHLAADLLLRHILRDLGPGIYNAALRDATRYLTLRLEDMAELEIPPPGR